MIYEIHQQVTINLDAKEIIATKEEADSVVDSLKKQLMEKYPEATINVFKHESEENYAYKYGAVYMVKHYNKFVPAVCLGNRRHWYWNNDDNKSEYKYTHIFRQIGKITTMRIAGDKPNPKIGDKICEKIQINEDRCQTCVAKFACLTSTKSDYE